MFLAGLPVAALAVVLVIGLLRPDAAIGLIVQTDGATVILDTRTGQTEATLDADVVAPDQRMGYRTSSDGATTRLEAFSMDTGDTRWSRELSGVLEARLATNDEVVVLAEPGGSTYQPVPRSRTTIVTVDRYRDEPAVHELAGNFEPEALSTDGSGVFVIAYTPARAPERYQVRRLDLASGEVGDVFTPDAHLQEEMGGTARTQVGSADGRRLYTLYTQTNPGGASTAFIHVLDLDEQWAHCILLPDGTGTGLPSETALGLSPDGSQLYVADRSTLAVVEVDAEELSVARSAAWAGDAANAAPVAVAVSDTTLALSSGTRLDLLARDTLMMTGTWDAGSTLVGIAADRRHLYAATNRTIAVLDPSGREITRLTPGNVGDIRQLGTSTRVADPSVVCAC